MLKDIRDGLTAALADGGTLGVCRTTGAAAGGWLGKRLGRRGHRRTVRQTTDAAPVAHNI
ncbi:hypothetical protein ACLBOM_38345 [Escherichia coli]